MPVSFPGWKVHTQTCKQCMLSRTVNPFTAHACHFQGEKCTHRPANSVCWAGLLTPSLPMPVSFPVKSAHADLQCKQCIFHFQYRVFLGWKSFHMLMKTKRHKDFKSGAFIVDFVGLSFLHFTESEMYYSKHSFAQLFCCLRLMKRNLWIVFSSLHSSDLCSSPNTRLYSYCLKPFKWNVWLFVAAPTQLYSYRLETFK